MATPTRKSTSSTRSTAAKFEQFTAEEKNVIGMYRRLTRWEKNALFLILQSAAWGKLTPATDGHTWPQMRRELGFDQGVRHG